MKDGENVWGKKNLLKVGTGNQTQSTMKKRMVFRPPNIRFSIRRVYNCYKKKIPSFGIAANLLTWRNLFFLSSDLKAHFKEMEEKQRHRVLSFIFYRNLIRIQNFGRAIINIRRQAAHFIKQVWYQKKETGLSRFEPVETRVILFRNRVMIRRVCRWMKWQLKRLRIKRNPFIFDKPMKYSLRKLLTIQRFARFIYFKKRKLPMIKITKLYATKGRSAIQTIYKQEQDQYHPLTLAYST